MRLWRWRPQALLTALSTLMSAMLYASNQMRCGLGSHSILAGITLLLVMAGRPALHARGDEAPPSKPPAEAEHQAVFADLAQRYCIQCHGPDTQEGDVRLDSLDLALENHARGALLEKILAVVSSGKMPPEGAEIPSAGERALLTAMIDDRLSKLAETARSRGRMRRLTVEEYNFTMQSLFGVDAEFAEMLPPDPLSDRGYRNDRERLGLSSMQLEVYLDSARRAVGRYLQFEEFDEPPLQYHIELEDFFYSTAERYKTRQRAPQPVDSARFHALRETNRSSPPAYVDPLGPIAPGAFSDDEALRPAIPKLHQQYVAIPRRLPLGEMIVRIRAAGTADRNGRLPRMRVEAGITLGDGCSIDKRVLGEIDVAASIDRPEIYEFRMRLENVPTKGPLSDEDSFDRLSVFDMDQVFISNVSRDPRAIFALGRGGYSDPTTGSKQIAGQLQQMADDGVSFLHLDCLEIEMVPGAGVANRPYRWRVAYDKAVQTPQQESAIVREFLGRFMRNAYRRPASAEEIAAKLDLFHALRQQKHSFEESVRETAAAVLISPPFLFLEFERASNTAPQGAAPTPHQLASRLSYWLWLSPPDEQLMKHADDGSLLQPEVLRSEAKRLLADPRSRRFLESFCRQWLRLDKFENVAVDREAYPNYDDDLAALSVGETLEFFIHVFESDASALELIDSDYAILNNRLADHYEIDGVTAGQLHKVTLPANSVRGGLLTQASVLMMNSDGVDSHPIRRGVWLLDRLLNTPPPPPPPNAPEIDKDDPNLDGLSLKERIELHRQPGACRNCHAKIDPWGIAFENFDAVGRWREQVEYRTAGESLQRPVEAAAVLPDGRRIDGIAGLKYHLRQEQGEQFAAALAQHMLTYALGRPPDYADRPQLKEIQQRFADSRYRLRELVLAIVDSQLFHQQAPIGGN